MVVGGLACAGGTWGYRVTARRTPALATERLGRLHLSTLLRLGDVERVPRVPPLAPRGNGKATTYRAPLATPGVGAGLTAATISSAVRAFSRSAIRRARRSVSALILAVAPSSGRRRRPPCRRRSPCRRAPPLAAPTPRATSRHRRPGTPGQAPGRSSPCGTATRCSPACRQSRACALQRPGATGGRRDQRPRQIPAYALTVLEYVSLAFRFRLDRRLRSAVGPKRTGRIVRICVIRECPPRTVAYTPPLATGHFSPRFRCPPPSPPRQPRAGGGYRYCRGWHAAVAFQDRAQDRRSRRCEQETLAAIIARRRVKRRQGRPVHVQGAGATTTAPPMRPGTGLGDSHTVTNRSRAPGQVPHKTSHSGGAGQVDRRPRAAGKRATGRRPPCRRTTHATSSQQPAPSSATRRAGRRAAQPTGDCRWGSGFSSPLWALAWR